MPRPPKDTQVEAIVDANTSADSSARYVFEDDVDTLHFLEGHDSGVSGNCGRAIVREFRQTIGTWWCKEMTNFNGKTIAVSFFIYFAAVAPAITFGAVYSKVTNDAMGAVEMLVATAWCGMAYAIIGGQPVMINGGTGPVLAFSAVLVNIAASMNVNFLVLNAWTGIWVGIFCVIAAWVDLNRMMKHATRFTDEIFSLLIASIFIVDALGSPFSQVGIYWYFTSTHKSHEPHANDPTYSYMASAFLSLVLCIGTTWLAFLLRGLKFSPFFPNDAWRTVICDFAVVLSILTFTLIANMLFDNVLVERLNVPDSIAPTQICCTADCMSSFPQDCPDIEPYGRRSWFVNLGAVNGKGWVPIFAAIPALLAFILVFLDDGITWHLLNHPSHKITHGEAFNYDTIIIAIMLVVNSLLGLQWLVAATVRSLNHLGALAEKNEKGKIISVQETRLTNLGIHTLVLVSLFALPVLKLIPVPVLYGVFLFMGLASLGTNQFFQRFLMFFMQPSRFPKEPFTQYMRPGRMHYYTCIQIGMFVLLLIFRSVKVIAIAFPIVIKACIPVRMYILTRIFTSEELIMIDTDDLVVREYLEYKEQKNSDGGGGKDGETTDKDVEFDEEEETPKRQLNVKAKSLGSYEETEEAVQV